MPSRKQSIHDIRQRALALYRMDEIIAYMRDGWSAQVACAKVGLRWFRVRRYLIEDENFYTEYYKSLKNVKRGWIK